jgi:hypothetical protein
VADSPTSIDLAGGLLRRCIERIDALNEPLAEDCRPGLERDVVNAVRLYLGQEPLAENETESYVGHPHLVFKIASRVAEVQASAMTGEEAFDNAAGNGTG